MQITENLIPLIEKAMGFALYPAQKQALLHNDFSLFDIHKRRQGKTTILIIREIIKNSDKDIYYRDIKKFSDRSYRETFYSNWFEREFMEIRERLYRVGIPVVKIIL